MPQERELIKLRWSDVDWHRRVITLHDTKNKERRLLPLMHYALELMEAQHKSRSIGSDLVFPSPFNLMRPWSSRTSWVSVLKKANIQDFRFHDLRHSCASYLAMNGASLAEIAEAFSFIWLFSIFIQPVGKFFRTFQMFLLQCKSFHVAERLRKGELPATRLKILRPFCLHSRSD